MNDAVTTCGVQRAGPVQGEDAVGEHLAPHGQAAPLRETGQGRVRHHADAELQGGAVGDTAATSSPMRRAASSGSAAAARLSGSSASTTRSMSSAVSSPSPYVHGIERFTCATTRPPRPARLDGGRQHVDLGPHRPGAVVRCRDVQAHDVRWQRGGEQLAAPATAAQGRRRAWGCGASRPHERGLVHHAGRLGIPVCALSIHGGGTPAAPRRAGPAASRGRRRCR